MKYFLAILAGLFVLGCVSASQNNGTTSTTKTSKSSKSSKAAKTQNAVYDEEFDLLVAPEYDYESDVPYAEQIKITTKTTSVSVNSTTKPAKQPVATKVN